ncbi:MAG: DUF2807 domain-containing protein [Hyphomonadaceae bacterium]|nr:DUF2807 domain-containing protein [Hyphomonadaceae bacterium]
MKIAIQWIIPAVALAASGGCIATSSEVASRTYNFDGFDSVSARAGVNVVLKEGPYSVSAEAPKNRLEKIVIEREGSTLVVRQEPHVSWMGWSTTPSIVTVVAPAYSRVEASGGADVDASSLNGKALELHASGGADINVGSIAVATLAINAGGGADINATSITVDTATIHAGGGADVDVKTIKVATLGVDASGGADISLAGTCTTLTAAASGGADFNGGKLTCTDGVVTASGGSDADITLTAKASGRASSGADVRIRGNPTSVDTDSSGGGDVEVASGS